MLKKISVTLTPGDLLGGRTRRNAAGGNQPSGQGAPSQAVRRSIAPGAARALGTMVAVSRGAGASRAFTVRSSSMRKSAMATSSPGWPRESRFCISLTSAPDRAVEPRTQFFAGDLARGLLHAVLGKAWRSSVPLEEKAHHVVERAGAGSAAADLQVEQEPDDAALQVVRDRGVGGALVRPVVLDPRVVRGLGERRSQPPGGAPELRDPLGPDGDEALRYDEARSPQRHHLVEAGEPFHRPQQ